MCSNCADYEDPDATQPMTVDELEWSDIGRDGSPWAKWTVWTGLLGFCVTFYWWLAYHAIPWVWMWFGRLIGS